VFGSEGSGNLGILLIMMTIAGRVLSGMYGLNVTKKRRDNDYTDALVAFAWMEIGVFFLEDGAAILLLAKSTGRLGAIESFSTYLTVTCGIIYTTIIVKFAIGEWVDGGGSCTYEDVIFMLVCAVLPVGGMIFFLYILATYVVFAENDDPPLSGELEVVAFVLYGVNALIVGGFAMYLSV